MLSSYSPEVKLVRTPSPHSRIARNYFNFDIDDKKKKTNKFLIIK